MSVAFVSPLGAQHAASASATGGLPSTHGEAVVAYPPTLGATDSPQLVPGMLPGTAATALALRRRRRRGATAARRAATVGQSANSGSHAKVKVESTSRKSVASDVILEAPRIDFDFSEDDGKEDKSEEASFAAGETPQFNWLKAWYPVHVLEIMDPVRPHKMQLLGINIVIWNDGPTINGEKQLGKWRVFEDACPHRQAPLSEGRVEDDGNLLCSYHAWRFNGEGDCVALPYSPEHLQEKHMCSCRAKCRAFQTREVDGLLFVWPDTGPNAAEESAAKDPPLIDELHDEKVKDKWIRFPINIRDLELGWDVFFENAMDPAHFLVAHHNVTGNRYTDPKWFDMKSHKKLDTENGVAVKGLPGTFDFRPPCLVKNSQEGGVIFAIYNTPTSPGKCRHIGFLVLDTDSIAGESGVVDKEAVQMFTGPVPVWLQHLATSFFLHQDAVLLHHQEQNFKDKGFLGHGESDKKFLQVTYTPNEVDKGSIQFRRWLRTRAGGGVPWACDPRLPPRLQTNEKIFDVWESHTKHCKYCMDAYRNINAIKNASFASAFGVALAAPEGPERVVAGVGFVAVGAALQKLSELFEKYEFNHQDNK